MQYVREFSACRRESNSLETATSREPSYRWVRGPAHNEAVRVQPSSGTVCAANDRNYLVPQCHVEPARCEGGAFIQPVCRATAAKASPGLGQLLQLKFAACHRRQRRAVSARYAPREITRPWQSIGQCTSGAALPNPSLKRSANGGPPGPVCGKLHSPQTGPGVPPSSPA